MALSLVQKSINLTEQQQHEVIELKRMFLQKIEPIMEERKQLNVQIQSNLPHDTFATKNALTYIKVCLCSALLVAASLHK